MRIALFIENIENNLIYKDFGQIALGFRDLGHEIFVITFRNNSETFPFPVKVIDRKMIISKEFWSKNQIDLLIFYSWLSLRYNKIVKNIRSLGVNLVLKLDSDGRIISPFSPVVLRGFGYFTSVNDFLHYALRLFQYLIFFCYISKKRVDQIVDANLSIIETPKAYNNLLLGLERIKKNYVKNKIVQIPNPVDQEFFVKENLSKKENLIISIGRWNDRAKNRECIIPVLKEILSIKPGWKYIIIGPGSNYFKKGINQLPELLREKIILKASIDRKKVFEYLKLSKILFLPSRWESYGLVAAEALVCGCSITGTPLESVSYFSSNGFSGSVSRDFKKKSIIKSLTNEIEKWDRNEYDSLEISEYWKEKFDRKTIAQNIINYSNFNN
jgi:hypothetical protein